MNIETRRDGTTLTMRISGWLDTSTAPELEQALTAVDPDVELLVIDLESLEYISSAGLRQLAVAHKRMNGNLKVTNCSHEIKSVLHMAGFDRRLDIS